MEMAIEFVWRGPAVPELNNALHLQEISDSDRSQSSAWHGRAVQAVRLYQITFNRVPDRAGLDHWTSRLDGRETFGDVATRFVDNPEFNTLYGSWTPRSIYQEFLANALGPNKTIPEAMAWRPEFGTLSTGQLLAKVAQALAISAYLKPYIGVFLDGLHNGTENYIGSLLLRRLPTPTATDGTDVAGEPVEASPTLSAPVQSPTAAANPSVSALPSNESADAPAIGNGVAMEQAPRNAEPAETPSPPDTSPPFPQTPQTPGTCLAPGFGNAANHANRTEHVISSSHQPFIGTPYSDFIRATAYVLSSNTERPQVTSTALHRGTVNGCAGYDVLALEIGETVVDTKFISIEELWVRAAQVDPRAGLHEEPAKSGALINGYGFGEVQTLILDSLPFQVKVPNLDSDVSVHIRNAAHSTTLDFGPAKAWGSERDIHISGLASDLHFHRASWLKVKIGGVITAPIGLHAPDLLSLRVIGENDITLNLSPATMPELRHIDATELTGRLVLHHETNPSTPEISQIRINGSPHGNDFSWHGSRNVFIRTGDGADIVTTGAGDDTIYAGGGRNIISTGSGYDRVVIEKASQSTLSKHDDNMTVICDFDTHSRKKIELCFLRRTDCANAALLESIQAAIDNLPPRASVDDAYFKAVEATDGCGWFSFKGNTYIFADNAEHSLVKVVGLHSLTLAEQSSIDHWAIIM
ncbi:hypothetical protein CHELA1G11_11285 [Hyphomicrobiales bacterium]|nr:hypothetical protein CHELA1G11_11285 [Hyphomicrobiales bacterium]CAH1668835.1 hypothetical protein CHELA1G2_13024 [Hyphomicrobiales bacterium]